MNIYGFNSIFFLFCYVKYAYIKPICLVLLPGWKNCDFIILPLLYWYKIKKYLFKKNPGNHFYCQIVYYLYLFDASTIK